MHFLQNQKEHHVLFSDLAKTKSSKLRAQELKTELVFSQQQSQQEQQQARPARPTAQR